MTLDVARGLQPSKGNVCSKETEAHTNYVCKLYANHVSDPKYSYAPPTWIIFLHHCTSSLLTLKDAKAASVNGEWKEGWNEQIGQIALLQFWKWHRDKNLGREVVM